MCLKKNRQISESDRRLKKRIDDGDSIYLVCARVWLYLAGLRLRTVIPAGPQTP